VTRAEARERAAASRAAQGLPPTISDAQAITAVASLIVDASHEPVLEGVAA
jgi:hypothetical protein